MPLGKRSLQYFFFFVFFMTCNKNIYFEFKLQIRGLKRLFLFRLKALTKMRKKGQKTDNIPAS